MFALRGQAHDKLQQNAQRTPKTPKGIIQMGQVEKGDLRKNGLDYLATLCYTLRHKESTKKKRLFISGSVALSVQSGGKNIRRENL